MQKDLRAWAALTLALGAAVLLSARHLAADASLAAHESAGLRLAVAASVGLCVLVVGVLLNARRLPAKAGDGAGAGYAGPDGSPRHPYVTLLLASFVALFVEVMLIRYCGSQVRIFAFYKNVPLVGCFLGLGLGCWLGAGGPRHVLRLLLWLVPFAFFLAHGSPMIETFLSRAAAVGSSEHILGDVIQRSASAGELWSSRLVLAAFCAGTLVAITLLFTLLGRLLGGAFEGLPRLAAYTVNILASLAGVLAFMALGYLETPPWVWFLVGAAPLLWWLRASRSFPLGAVLAVASCLAVAPQAGDVVWSRYQKLVGHVVSVGPVPPAGSPASAAGSEAYMVQISDVFYQVAMDLRPAAVARLGFNPYPHYDGAFAGLPALTRVLIVGSGTGNDVAAALRAGAVHVDAVDIDPAIVRMGRRHHPERPYDDPRARVIVDDARRAFRTLPPESYDAVVFGLLDSHTQLGISSVRLDNYVFTLESLASARRLVRPGGFLIVTAATFQDWFRARFVAMLEATCATPVEVRIYGAWTSLRCRVGEGVPPRPTPEQALALPSDDWPFLYLPGRAIPGAYLVVVGLLALTSIVVLRAGGLDLRSFTPYYGHLFFLGAAFLLMEVVAINRLALLFGTTWIVSAVTIALVLVLILAANLTVLAAGAVPYAVAYGGLTASLLAGYAIGPDWALGRGTAAALLYGLLVLLPVYFAGLAFARSFRAAALAGPAIGANILGSVFGGWSEYLTMAVGIRAMSLLALSFYLASLLMLLRHAVSRGPTVPPER